MPRTEQVFHSFAAVERKRKAFQTQQLNTFHPFPPSPVVIYQQQQHIASQFTSHPSTAAIETKIEKNIPLKGTLLSRLKFVDPRSYSSLSFIPIRPYNVYRE